MIYTLTLNPSLDYHIEVNDLQPLKTNRTASEKIYCGGKGINVSRVLKEFDINSVVLGFVAGPVGRAIEQGLNGIETDLIELKSGSSRINIKLHEEGGITEINGAGPDIDDESLNMLLKRVSELVSGDMLVISGSVPPTLPKDIYGRIAAICKDKGADLVVDAASSLLINALNYGPAVIKPNIDELSEIAGKDIDILDADTIYEEALKLQKKGAKEVIVSAGSFGAYLVDQSGNLHMATAYQGKAVDTVGAGDSLLAGFIAGKKKGLSSDKALELSVAAGCACAFTEGLPTREDINRLYKI